MDRDRIEKELESLYPRKERYHDKLSTVSVCHFAEHIAAIARNEALEEAAKMADDYINSCESLAADIRALKS